MTQVLLSKHVIFKKDSSPLRGIRNNMFPIKPKKKRLVYLDHAATTPVDLAVKKAMDPYFCQHYANPSGLYESSREVNGALNDARRKVAGILHALPDNIIFTGGGSESDNLAIFGIARKHQKFGKHIITTKIEHHAVLLPMEQLKKEGFDVTFLDVDEQGFVTKEQVKSIAAGYDFSFYYVRE